MATTVQMQGIIQQTVHNAVLTPLGSKMFLQKLIPCSIASILYRRTNINRNDFAELNYEGQLYQTFKINVKTPILKKMSQWVAGVIDAFNKDYLREIYLFFTTKYNNDEILESYKFVITYVNPGDKCQSRDELMQSTSSLLKFIDDLQFQGKVLEENEFNPYICVTYYENVTPFEYRPPNFIMPDGQIDAIIDSVSTPRNSAVLTTLATGFHEMQCNTLKQSAKYTDAELTCHLHDVEHSNEEKLKPQENCNESISTHKTLSESSALSSNDDLKNVECVCLIRKVFDNIDLVRCIRCLSSAHAPCLGYIHSHKEMKPYVCEYCDKENNGTISTPGDCWRRQCTSVYRLAITYAYINNRFPSEVLRKVNNSMRKHLIKKFILLKIVEETKDGYSVVHDKLNTMITKIFSNSNSK